MLIVAGPTQVSTATSVGSGAWFAIGWSDGAKGPWDSHHPADPPGLIDVAECVVRTSRGHAPVDK